MLHAPVGLEFFRDPALFCSVIVSLFPSNLAVAEFPGAPVLDAQHHPDAQGCLQAHASPMGTLLDHDNHTCAQVILVETGVIGIGPDCRAFHWCAPVWGRQPMRHETMRSYQQRWFTSVQGPHPHDCAASPP